MHLSITCKVRAFTY